MDSDRESDDRSQATENEIKCQNWQEDGVLAFCTRKREIENYINKNLVDCKFNDYDDAKNIISKNKNFPARKVINEYWPQMTADQIISSSKYTDNGQEKVELKDVLSKILDEVN